MLQTIWVTGCIPRYTKWTIRLKAFRICVTCRAGRGGAGQGQKPGQGRGLNLQSLFFSGSLTFAQESLGGKPGVYFVIVCSSTNHNINDFAPSPRSQNHIFWCHTVTNVTDLRKSPLGREALSSCDSLSSSSHCSSSTVTHTSSWTR